MISETKSGNSQEKSNETMARIKERAISMRKDIDGYIQKNPKTSVLIAVGTGAIVGAAIAGAVMRKKQEI